MLTYEKFSGINNVTPEHRMGTSDLTLARDVDIGLTGEITRRAGFVEVSPDCHKNLHQAQGFMLATNGGELVAIHPSGARHVIHPSLGHGRVWYCDLPDGRTTFSNGMIRGVTDGMTGKDMSVRIPEEMGDASSSTFGELHDGEYRYHLSYVRLDDQAEGPASASSAPVSLTGGLRIDGLPAREGHAINVYLTGKDGDEPFLAGTTVESWFEFAGNNARLVLPCRVLGAMPLPVGTITGFWRGRVLVAHGNVLWASRPSAPHLADWRDFKQLAANITAIQPVADGVYVGTEQDLIFLGGATWDSLAHVQTKRGPVVLGSGVSAPGHQIRLGDGAGSGEAMLCIAGGEIVAGFSGGQTYSLTAKRYKTEAREVCAAFRVVDEIPQYMAIPR